MSKISKNIFIGILSLTTIYLGWIAFAHAATFTTQKNQWAPMYVYYGNCQTYSNSTNTKMNVVKGSGSSNDVGQFVLKTGTMECPQYTVARSVTVERVNAPDDSGDENIKAVNVQLVCCSAQIYGVHS